MAKSSLYVIDVMPLLYRGHFAFLRNPRMTSTGINTSALTGFIGTVMQILDSRAPTHIVLVQDSFTPTFRHEAYPEYKAQREKMPEDIGASIPMAEEFAAAMKIPIVRADGFEADDLMGSYAAAASAVDDMETFLVTGDKDIAQLVDAKTFLYRIGKNAPEIFGPAEVCAHWGLTSPAQMIDYLALAGDSSDNIPGIRGVGEKTASTLISQYGDIESVIAHASEIKGKLGEKVAAGAEDARMSRFLTTIRRDVPLPVAIDGLARQEPDTNALRAFCAKYEMNSLARRLLGGEVDGKVESGKWKVESGQTATQVSDLPLFGGGGQNNHSPNLPISISPSSESNESNDVSDTRLQTLADWPHDYTLVRDETALTALAEALRAAPEFAFDTETTGLEPRKCALVGLSFSTEPGRAWYVPFMQGPEGMDAEAWGRAVVAALAPIFASDKPKIGHNARFDCAVLAHHGMAVAQPIRDSLLTHFVLDASERHGMDRLAREYLRYDPIPITRLIGEGRQADPARMAALPPESVCDYAAEDADVTLRLYRVLRPEAEKLGLKKALEESEEPLGEVLNDMEAEGVRIDPAALHAFGDELDAELCELERAIYDSAGTSFNINSPKQLGEVLFDLLKIDPKAKRSAASGQYATGEEVLQKLTARHPVVQMILDYRAAGKLKSTYADKLPACIDPETGRVHTHFSQAMTETGRLASSDPNLQNIPVRTERGKRIREAFVARDDDHLLMSADYSQIELRLMAALSGDKSMLEAFKNGADIHTETAARVYDVMPGLVTPEMRSKCKMVNFGIIYGISAFGLSQRLGVPRKEAADLIESYFREYPGIKAYMEKAVADAREKGYAETVLKRRRMLRDISSRNATVRQAAERNAINTPVQGSAADLIKIAMVRVHRALREAGLKTKLVLQIHDELLLDMPKGEEEAVRAIVRDAMVNALDFGVPLEVEIGVGKTWLDAH
jgi:DNA polymerase-1